MSGKKYVEKKSNMGAMVATIIVAAAAIAAVVVLVIMLKKDDAAVTLPDGSKVNFSPTQEQLDECLYSAHDLVASNYEVIKLYITQGLPHYDEPYGNAPEDGIYTVNSDKYTSVEEFQSFLKSVYTEQAAEEIWNLGVYKARYMKDGLAYTGTDINGAGVEQVLGISADFEPQADYAVDWSSSPVEVLMTSEEACVISIYVNGASISEESADDENVIQSNMVKENGEWRLTELIS